MQFSVTFICICYLVLVNLFAFALMGIDKRRAIKQAFRIPELNLFLSAAIGGSLGAILGMYLFRHKTKHISFLIIMPLILFIQLAFLIWLFFYSPFTFLIMY